MASYKTLRQIFYAIFLTDVVGLDPRLASVAALPLWTWAAQRFSKRAAYIGGMSFWALVQCAILAIQPGQVTLVLAGVGVSTAHVLPDAIFPDVIDWDELRTRRRHEGMYYGAKNFIRKVTGALAIFLALQALGWSGYLAPPEAATRFSQPATALEAIRIMAGPVGALLLLGAAVAAWRYPLTRERHDRIRRLLERRQVHESGRRWVMVLKIALRYGRNLSDHVEEAIALANRALNADVGAVDDSARNLKWISADLY